MLNVRACRESIVIRARIDATGRRQRFSAITISQVSRHRQMITIGSGAAIAQHRSAAICEDCRLPVPPLPEQRAIAEALSDVDALLGGLDRLIAKKRDLKQAAMQQLLTGQTRLPGFHGEWEVKRLGDVAISSSGGARSTTKRRRLDWQRHYVEIVHIADIDRRRLGKSSSRPTISPTQSDARRKATCSLATRRCDSWSQSANVAILGCSDVLLDSDFVRRCSQSDHCIRVSAILHACDVKTAD